MKRATEKVAPDISEFTEGVLPMWTKTSKIRYKQTGIMMTVITIFPHATLIADQNEINMGYVMGKLILERDYDKWATDSDMKNSDEVDFEGTWKYHHVSM
jgi:hypothetical protein